MNAVEDHIHILVRLRTDQSIADVVKTIKGNTWEHFKTIDSKMITWQDGYAAITVSPDSLRRVRSYIYNQEKHHREKSLADELSLIKTEIRNHQ